MLVQGSTIHLGKLKELRNKKSKNWLITQRDVVRKGEEKDIIMRLTCIKGTRA